MPVAAALEALALALAAQMFPDTLQQTLLDMLVTTAVAALARHHGHPPRLYERDRERWKMSAALRPGKDA